MRIALTHAQRAAIRNGHKPPWRDTRRHERIEKVLEEVIESIASICGSGETRTFSLYLYVGPGLAAKAESLSVDVSDEEKLMELGDAIWTLTQMYDNEGLLDGEEE